MDSKRKTTISLLTSLLEEDIKPGIEKALKKITEGTNKASGLYLLKSKTFSLALLLRDCPYIQDLIRTCENYFKINGILDRIVSILADFAREIEPKISAKKEVLNFKFASFLYKSAYQDLLDVLNATVYLSSCGLIKWPFDEVETVNIIFILLNTSFCHNGDDFVAFSERCINPGVDLSHLNQEVLVKRLKMLYNAGSYYFKNPAFIALFLAKRENQKLVNLLFNRLKTEAILSGDKWEVSKIRETIENVERFIKSLKIVVPESTDVEHQAKRNGLIENKVKSVVYAIPHVFFGHTGISVDSEIEELLSPYVEECEEKCQTCYDYLIPWKSVIVESYRIICDYLKVELRGSEVTLNTEALRSHCRGVVKKLYLELINTLAKFSGEEEVRFDDSNNAELTDTFSKCLKEKEVKSDNTFNSQLPDSDEIKNRISELVRWISCCRIARILEEGPKPLSEFFASYYRYLSPSHVFSREELETPDEFVKILTRTLSIVNKTLEKIKRDFKKGSLTTGDVISHIREVLKTMADDRVFVRDVTIKARSLVEKSSRELLLSDIAKMINQKVVRQYLGNSIQFSDLISVLLEIHDLIEETHPGKITGYKKSVKRILRRIRRHYTEFDNVYDFILTGEISNENDLKRIKGLYVLLSIVKALKSEFPTELSCSLQRYRLNITFKSELATSFVLAIINAEIIKALKRKNTTEIEMEKLHRLNIFNEIPFPEEIKDLEFKTVLPYFYELVAESELKTAERKSESQNPQQPEQKT